MKCFNSFTPIESLTTNPNPNTDPEPESTQQDHAIQLQTMLNDSIPQQQHDNPPPRSEPQSTDNGTQSSKAITSATANRYTSPARTENEYVAALKLIADSVAQQRQIAAKSLLTDPLYWALMLYILQQLYRALYHEPMDWIMILMTWCGCQMAGMTAVKFTVRGYLDAAERTGSWVWLYEDEWVFEAARKEDGEGKGEGMSKDQGKAKAKGKGNGNDSGKRGKGNGRKGKKKVRVTGSGGGKCKRKTKSNRKIEMSTSPLETELASVKPQPQPQLRRESIETLDAGASKKKLADRDWVLVSRFGGEVIGTIVLRIRRVEDIKTAPGVGVLDSSDGSASTVAGVCRYRKKAFIRAWTVKQRYRGHGIGVELLESAVRFAREKGWGDPVFADDHANSLRVLPRMFNERMDVMDRRAREKLDNVAWEVELSG